MQKTKGRTAKEVLTITVTDQATGYSHVLPLPRKVKPTRVATALQRIASGTTIAQAVNVGGLKPVESAFLRKLYGEWRAGLAAHKAEEAKRRVEAWKKSQAEQAAAAPASGDEVKP